MISVVCFGFADKPAVTTTLAPYAYALEKIGGQILDIHVLIPENSNPHIYETKPQDIKKLALSKLWFCSGENIESKNKALFSAKKVDLNQNIQLISSHSHDHSSCHKCHHDHDLHTWMSPGNYLKQSKIILEALCEQFPENKEIFETNYQYLANELNTLIQKVEDHKSQESVMIVSHAAYAYLCQDLSIKQVSLEYEGKEAHLKHIQSIYKTHKNDKIRSVFAEIQHTDSGAKRLAELLKSTVVPVNPYQKNYPESIKEILTNLP
jgi:zinc transport system substrate-binding protein